MSKIQFDSSGKPVMPESVKQDLEREKDCIVLDKIQVRLKSPAIAQLKVRAGENVEDSQEVLREIKSFCKEFGEKRYPSVEKRIFSKNGALIIESKGAWKMYTYFRDLVEYLRLRIKGYDVIIKGSWESRGDAFL